MTSLEFIEQIPFAKKAYALAYNDYGLIAINKAANLMTHPNPPKKENANARIINPQAGKSPKKKEGPAMIDAKYNFEREYFSWENDEGKKMRLYLINRLDSPTSGVVLAASNEKIALCARKAFKEKTAQKIYYAICTNRTFDKFGEWRDYLKIKKTFDGLRAYASPQGLESFTKYSIEESDQNNLGLSLIKLEPITGRTHQLRVQCQARNMPILGDATYGNFEKNKYIRRRFGISRMFLHCKYTKIELDMDGEKIEFDAEAPLPESFDIVMKDERTLIREKTENMQND